MRIRALDFSPIATPINAAHKSMEKAFQKSKEHPVMYGLAAAEAADLAKEGVVTIIEIVDSTAYDVRFKLNDDDQCLNIYIYINGKLTGAEAYRHLINLSEDEVVTELSKAATNAIIAYRIR